MGTKPKNPVGFWSGYGSLPITASPVWDILFYPYKGSATRVSIMHFVIVSRDTMLIEPLFDIGDMLP